MNHVQSNKPLLGGRASPAGTRRFAATHARPSSHYRSWRGLTLSSIGVGTYLGELDEATDAAYRETVRQSLAGGLNVFDTAVSYRCQRSERAIGAALRAAIEAGEVDREQVVICSKAGYLPGDGTLPADAHTYFEDTYFKPGIIDRAHLVERSHCISPPFLSDQLERSRRNLGLATIDIYYLHNPETQLKALTRPEWKLRVQAAFAFLEAAAREGKIGCYGFATWDGFRRPESAEDALLLSELIDIAQAIGGPEHHFAAVQLPLNLAMPEAYTLKNQHGRTLLDAASEHGLFVASSASILQGHLARLELSYPDSGLETSAQHALQLVRSTPGVTSALVGLRTQEHRSQALAVSAVPTLSKQDVSALFDVAD